MSGFQQERTDKEFAEWLRQGSPETPLSGNLEKVNKSSLIEAKPSNLVVGNDYLLLDNDTNEKKKGKLIRTEITENDDDEIIFQYFFENNKGEFFIEGTNRSGRSKNTNPFDKNVVFLERVSVFIPKTKEIIQRKLEDVMPEDMAKETVSNLGGKSKKRKTKTQTMKKRTTKKNKNKKQMSNERRTRK